MTYYYAICECDSAETASAVYAACDGLEFERSANKLDLRYVPDGQSFVGREIRDAAVSVPSDYEPPEFSVKALQQTNVKLSWDDDDPARKKAFARKLTEDKLKDEDFAAYMALTHPVLVTGLQQVAEYQLCQAAVGTTGDICRALERGMICLLYTSDAADE